LQGASNRCVCVCTVCCLGSFYDKYTTLSSFGHYIHHPGLPLQAEIAKQDACRSLNSPPTNDTIALLNTSLNFVHGNFSRMRRSTATLDTRKTRGYQDVLLFLAQEDMETMGAVRTPLPMGHRLRFFVGMAHIKALRSNRLAVSFSQVEVVADITTSYTFTSQTSSDFTFIRDVVVQLREVKHDGSENTTKFATITVIVPETLTSLDTINIIPPTSLTIGVGIVRTVLDMQKVYPCTQVYAGPNKLKIDNLIQTQTRCALQDPICQAQGPVAVGSGGSIRFTFALPDSTWDDTMLADDALFRKSLFIDFMIRVTDANGRNLLTNLQTQTQLLSTSIARMCTEQVVASDIRDVISVDIFLGLVGQEESFNASLLANLDVSNQEVPMDMRREISSLPGNIMTLVIKGDPALFEQAYARDYTLAVEDIITLHFLDKDKMLQVQGLIDSGAAFRSVKQPFAATRCVQRPLRGPLELFPGPFRAFDIRGDGLAMVFIARKERRVVCCWTNLSCLK